MTDDEGVGSFIFVDILSAIGLWLDLDLAYVSPTVLMWESVLLTGLALKPHLTQFLPVGFTCFTCFI